jgi:N-acetyl-alpha-D-glucosaminyl L-malate synthase BshA
MATASTADKTSTAACPRGVKLACTLHGTDITLVGRERGFYELTRFAIQRQDLLTAPSAWLATETDKHFGTAPGTVMAIPNFVELERFRPDPAAPARALLAPQGQAVLTHVSNFRPVKRVEEVVSAFAVVRRRMPAVLVLVGDGPELPKAEQMARELGVRDDVRVLGNQPPEPILQASDLFLLPSVAESFGLAALEAMACGVPVLGYQAGGLPEVVEDGVTGLLVFGSGIFFQWLEGPRHGVLELMDKLKADPRHDSIVQLSATEEVRERLFPEWDMELVTAPDIRDVLVDALDHTKDPQNAAALRLLLEELDSGKLGELG